MKNIFLGIILALVIGLGVFAFIQNKKTAPASPVLITTQPKENLPQLNTYSNEKYTFQYPKTWETCTGYNQTDNVKPSILIKDYNGNCPPWKFGRGFEFPDNFTNSTYTIDTMSWKEKPCNNTQNAPCPSVEKYISYMKSEPIYSNIDSKNIGDKTILCADLDSPEGFGAQLWQILFIDGSMALFTGENSTGHACADTQMLQIISTVNQI